MDGTKPPAADPEAQLRFLETYKGYVEDVIEPAQYELRGLLSRWRRVEAWEEVPSQDTLFSPSPIQNTTTRIKRPESILDKVSRKPHRFTSAQPIGWLRHMHDVLGGRIVTYFLRDLPLVDYAIRHHPSIEICPDDLPVCYLDSSEVERLGLKHFERLEERPSGYTSLHYILRFRRPDIEDEQPWFELQVRTLAQHAWAEIEHILGYKTDVHVPFYVHRQLGLLSKQRGWFDDQFELVRDELDGIAQRGEQVANESSITPPVLSALLQESGLKVPRDWVSQTLKLLHSRGVDNAGKFRSLMELDAIRPLMVEVYQSELGRPPRDMEVVSTLANLADLQDTGLQLDQDSLRRRMVAQIRFDQEWQEYLQRTRTRS